MRAIYKKELKSYFSGMVGAIFVGFVLLIAGIFTVVYNLQGRYPYFEYVLTGISFIYLLVVPILTMRSVAEEKHSRTDKLLYSLPVTVTSVVMAKYFAMLTVLAIPCAVMAFYPLILCAFGTVQLSSAYATLLAFYLLGAALISIGLFISSTTESQVIAAVVSLGVLVLINFMSGIANLIPTSASASLVGFILIAVIVGIVTHTMIKNVAVSLGTSAVLICATFIVYFVNSSVFEGAIPNLFSALAIFDRLSSFQNGMFDLTAIAFYISISALFVYLTVQSMEKKRWS